MTSQAKAEAFVLKLNKQRSSPPKSRGLALRYAFRHPMHIEGITWDILYPDNPVGKAIEYLEELPYSKLIYHPLKFRAFPADDIYPDSKASVVYIINAGRADLIHIVVGTPTNARIPTLRITLKPYLAELYGADRLIRRLILEVLQKACPNWHLHSHIRNAIVSYNIARPRDDLLVWRDYLHGDLNMEPNCLGNCTIINRNEQMLSDYNITLHKPWTSLEWFFQPRQGLPLFDGVRGIKNPMRDMHAFDREQVVHAYIQNEEFHGIHDGMLEPQFFAKEIRNKLTYRQRQHLFSLFNSHSRTFDLTDGMWDMLLRGALNRSDCLGLFAN